MKKPIFKVLPEWEKYMERIAKDSAGSRGCNAHSIVLKSFGHSIEYDGYPCHSHLGRDVNVDSDWVVSVVWNEHKHTRPLIHWLINSIQYGSYIVNKTVPDVFKRGLIVTSLAPSNILSQIMIITRQLWEFPRLVDTWHDIKSAGVAPDLAFALAHHFTKHNGYYQLTCTQNLHSAMSSKFMDRQFFRNFLNGRPKNPNQSYKDNISYRGVFGLWSATKSSVVPESFKHYLHNFELVQDKQVDIAGWSTNKISVTSLASFKRQVKELADEIEKGFRDD